MHPEIQRDEPGNCPICGMALEPMGPSGGPSEELTDFTRRLWISAAAAVPLVIITMGEFVALDVRAWLGHRMSVYAEFVLATPVILAQPLLIALIALIAVPILIQSYSIFALGYGWA